MVRVSSSRDLWAGVIYLAIGAAGPGFDWANPMGTAGRMGSGYFPEMLATIRVGFGILGLVRGFTITSPAISAVRRRRPERACCAAHQRNPSRILSHLPRSHIASGLPQISRCGRREIAGHLITGAQTMTI
jgi:hypothetical protein